MRPAQESAGAQLWHGVAGGSASGIVGCGGRALGTAAPCGQAVPTPAAYPAAPEGEPPEEDTEEDVSALALLLEGLAPERPRIARRSPPFSWEPASDYVWDFRVSGDANEVVTKVRDLQEPDWAIPVAGTLRLFKGGLYRWTLLVERLPPHRPHFQLGLHGAGHQRPWRLLSAARCSTAVDDGPWQSRPNGDRAIVEGDYVHVEVDLRGLHLPFGTLSVAVNSEPLELAFEDMPLDFAGAAYLMPVVLMGGDQARVVLQPAT